MYKPKPIIEPSEYSRKIKNQGDYRREKQRLEYEAMKKHALSSPRPIEEDLPIQGIGQLRMQILYLPSFKPNYLWDIREIEENGVRSYSLYENELLNRKQIAPGYKKVEIASAELSLLLKKVSSTKVSLRIGPLDRYGLDGTGYGLHLFENLQRVIKLSWWEEPQEDMLELYQVLQQYIEIFKHIEEKNNVV